MSETSRSLSLPGWLVPLVGALALANAAGALELQGRIVAIDEDGSQRGVPAVEIRVEATRSKTTTADGGFFRLTIPDTYRPGSRVPLVIDRAGWVIRHPARGQVKVPPLQSRQAIEIEIVPKGSKLLFADDQLRQLIADAVSASIQSRPAATERRELDSTLALGEWAAARGFRLVDAEREIERWAHAAMKKTEDIHARGLAKIALQRFSEAQADFDLATTQWRGEITALSTRDARRPDKRGRLEQRLADAVKLAGWAAYLGEDFVGATQRMREVLARSSRDLAPSEWSRNQNDLGNALSELGVHTQDDTARERLTEAAAAYRVALDNLERERAPQLWAVIQNNLGLVLREKAIRTSGEPGARLLSESQTAFRLALEVRRREEWSGDWAVTQNDLGTTLQLQAARTGGDAGLEQLAAAITAFRGACELLPREALPRLWATAHNNLGSTLASLATQAGGPMSSSLLQEAVEAFRSALDVFTAQQHKQEWAAAQTHVGNVLQELGYRAEGDASRQRFAEALSAYRAALEVFTRGRHPEVWAATANNLGTALEALGSRTVGEAGDKLLAAAAAAHRSVLELFTRDQHPRDWATTQNHLGNALHSLGLRTEPEAAARAFQEALASHRAALEVITRETSPELWSLIRADEARVLDEAGQGAAAAAALRDVLAATPADRALMLRLIELYHDVLHDHQAALGVVTSWLQRFPDDSLAAVRSVEFLFATGRSQETVFLTRHLQIGLLAEVPELRLVAKGYEVASLLAMQDLDEAVVAFQGLHRLLASLPAGWQPTWRYAGSRHYLDQIADLANRRAIDRLFQALEGPDLEAVLSGLGQIEAGIERGLKSLEKAGDLEAEKSKPR